MSDGKLSIALKELELVQLQLDKYDDLSARIKTWTVTLWIASLGWYFQANNKNIIILNVVVILALWFLDIYNKNFREDYKKRREAVALGLESFFKNSVWPGEFSSPVMPRHETKNIIKYFFVPHISLNYLPLIFISLLIYLLL